MSFLNCQAFFQLFFFLFLFLKKSSAGCDGGDDFECWYKQEKARNDICSAKGWSDYYTTPYIDGWPISGTCHCCRKTTTTVMRTTAAVVTTTTTPDNLLFKGTITGITSFYRKRAEKLLKVPLVVDPNAFNTSQTNLSLSIKIKGVDVKFIEITDFSWRDRLTSCNVQSGMTLKKKLWENTWVNETKFWDDFLANQCNQSGKRIMNLTSKYELTRNVIKRTTGEGNIEAYRYYAKDRFDYTIEFNISGTWDKKSNDASAEDLIRHLPKTYTLVIRLDEFTIVAKTTAKMESQFPVSTLYR